LRGAGRGFPAFEELQFVEGGLEGPLQGVDAGLEAAEVGAVGPIGLSGGHPGLGSESAVVGIGEQLVVAGVQAAEHPLVVGESVDVMALFRGGRSPALVILLDEEAAGFGVLEGE